MEHLEEEQNNVTPDTKEQENSHIDSEESEEEVGFEKERYNQIVS